MKHFSLILVFVLFFSACKEQISPRPYGYFRIDVPEHKYVVLNSEYPYQFDFSMSAEVRESFGVEPSCIDIYYPVFDGTIYCSFKRFKRSDFHRISEESRELAYKHVVRADAITERVFMNKEAKVYGILYEMKGASASPVQFFLTDSVSRYLRGSLYFNALPNPDSIAPVLNFVREDILRLIETLEWR